MTFSINGFGTTWTTRTNERRAHGVCPDCGAPSRRSFFDTFKAVSAFHIPVWKLRPLRIISLCGLCGRHLEMDGGAWQREADALVVAAAGTTDPGAMHDRIDAAVVLLDGPRLRALLDDAAARFRDDAGVLGRVGRAFLDLEDADRAIDLLGQARALVSADHATAWAQRRDLERDRALALVLSGRAHDALTDLESTWRHPRADDAFGIELAWLVVEGLAMQGRTDEALRLLGRLEQAFPAEAKRWAAARPQAPGQRFPARILPLVRIPSPAPPRPPPKPVDLRVLAAALGAGVLVWVAVAAFFAHFGEVHIVSGVVHPYEVVVGGERLTLAPGDVVRRRAGMAAQEIQRISPTGVVDTIAIPARAMFFALPLTSLRHRVINPDGAAVILHETTIYTAPGTPPTDEGAWSIARAGVDGFVADLSADFAFQSFPETLQIKGRRVKKDRIAVADAGPRVAVAFLDEKAMDATPVLRARLRFDHTDTQAITLLAARAPGPETAALLEALRFSRPLHPDLWIALETATPQSTLPSDTGARMAALLEGIDAGPPDPCAAYLRRRYALGELRPSLADARGCPIANVGLAHRAIVRGDLEEAASLLRATPVDLDAGHLELWRTGMVGAGLLDERFAIEERLGVDPVTIARLRATADPATLPAARRILDAAAGTGDVRGDMHLLEELEAYVAGDLDRLLQIADDGDGPPETAHEAIRFEVDLVRGALDEHLATVETLNEPARVQLLAATLRHRHKDGPRLRRRFEDELAAQARAQGIEGLTLFSAPPDVAMLRRLRVGLDLAQSLAVAAAEAFPENDAIEAEARRLCFTAERPFLFFTTRVGTGPGKGGETDRPPLSAGPDRAPAAPARGP